MVTNCYSDTNIYINMYLQFALMEGSGVNCCFAGISFKSLDSFCIVSPLACAFFFFPNDINKNV